MQPISRCFWKAEGGVNHKEKYHDVRHSVDGTTCEKSLGLVVYHSIVAAPSSWGLRQVIPLKIPYRLSMFEAFIMPIGSEKNRFEDKNVSRTPTEEKKSAGYYLFPSHASCFLCCVSLGATMTARLSIGDWQATPFPKTNNDFSSTRYFPTISFGSINYLCSVTEIGC